MQFMCVTTPFVGVLITQRLQQQLANTYSLAFKIWRAIYRTLYLHTSSWLRGRRKVEFKGGEAPASHMHTSLNSDRIHVDIWDDCTSRIWCVCSLMTLSWRHGLSFKRWINMYVCERLWDTRYVIWMVLR